MNFNMTENLAVESFREPGLKSSSVRLGGEASWFQKCVPVLFFRFSSSSWRKKVIVVQQGKNHDLPDTLTTRFVSEKSGFDPQFGVKNDYNTHEPQLLLQQRRIKSGKMRKFKQNELTVRSAVLTESAVSR